jgi:fatty-acyl-CoA synthase
MPVQVDRLIEPYRVHGSLYTDPGLFAEELRVIFGRQWVCLGHLSEIGQSGDYLRRSLGLDDVIVARTGDGSVKVLHNRCAHRGNLVCEAERGNSGSFRCPYHGWTYRNDGTLIGYPYRRGYENGKLDLGLAEVPRVDTYQGFIFASMAADGPGLIEHLGVGARELDRLADLSPQGELELTGSWLKHRTKANWKILAENTTDGYHPQFVHSSIIQVSGHALGHLYSDRSSTVVRDLGGGHAELDQRPEFARLDKPLMWCATSPDRVPRYVESLRAQRGADADRIMTDGAPHVLIFPNLFIAEVSIFLYQPVAVNETIQLSTAVQLKGGADLNDRLMSQCVGSIGPAGLLLADDTEMHERNQVGVAASRPEWIDLTRGSHREWTDADGLRTSIGNDETGIRAFWSHYRTLMST